MTTANRRIHAAALFCYALLAFVVMYPLWFNNGTHAAGYDYFHFHWNFWWVKTAFASSDLSVFESNYVMFPHDNNMAYTTLSLFWYPLWAVLEPIIGTLTAMTVITYVGILLQGYAFFVFLRYEKVSPSLALIGGFVLQATPLIRYFYYNTHINLIGWFWLPIHLLLWQQVARSIDAGRLRSALMWGGLQAVGLWLMILTDLQFPLMLGFLLIPVGLVTLWRSPRRLLLIGAGLAIVAVALLLLWFVGPLRYVLEGVDGTIPGTVEDRPGIPFPQGFLWTMDEWWYWNVPTLGGFVAIAVISALVISLRWRDLAYPRDRWLWFGLMLPPLLIAIGPDFPVYRWLFDLTGGNFRMPWRTAPVYVIAGVIFAAKTWTPLLAQIRLSANLAVMTVGVLLMAFTLNLYEAGPVQAVVPEYDFYTAMGQEENTDYVIIQAPTGAGTGELLIGNAEAIALQYYGIEHHHRVINGFLARASLDHFWYLRTDDPLLSWLGQRRDLEPDVVEAQLREIIPAWPVGYIVLHKEFIPDVNDESAREIIGYLNSMPDLLCPVYIEGEAIAYRSTWHPTGCPTRTPSEVGPGTYQIDIGSADDQRFLGWGWYWEEAFGGLTARWTGERDVPATLYVDLPPGAYTVRVVAQAFEGERDVTLVINDERVETVTVTAENLSAYEFTVPADVIGDGENLLIALDYGAIATEAPGGRKLGILVDQVEFQRVE